MYINEYEIRVNWVDEYRKKDNEKNKEDGDLDG